MRVQRAGPLVLLLAAANAAAASPPPPPTPTGEGGHCPFFSSSPGSTVSGAGSSVCAPPLALRKWQGLKFGLFLHWGAYSQIGFDASWSLNWKTGASCTRCLALPLLLCCILAPLTPSSLKLSLLLHSMPVRKPHALCAEELLGVHARRHGAI